MILHQQTDPTDHPIGAAGVSDLEHTRAHQLAIIAHELRQPLTAILFAIEQARDVFGNPFAAHELREVARREAAYMSRIIDDVMDMYCGQHGQVRLHIETVALPIIVHDSIATVQPSLAARGHNISVFLPPDPVSLRADRARLHQVLINLLSNAAKYTGPGGQIYLSADVENDKLAIRVRDTGRGIPPELLPRIFQPFQGLGNSGSQKGEGLGIGLALTKSLVELHSGTIAAFSRGWGMGSEFVVQLPLGIGRA
jgi:signal transduction histidine kinase